jgi:hypothetical protein
LSASPVPKLIERPLSEGWNQERREKGGRENEPFEVGHCFNYRFILGFYREAVAVQSQGCFNPGETLTSFDNPERVAAADVTALRLD